ncbi:hypothetical protein [Streptomyces hydrogenans]|uniref:hypothetical protein n=1 Tax=Streptomyces hydrogenans TaxID=1873719 RepID=UPI0036F041A9
MLNVDEGSGPLQDSEELLRVHGRRDGGADGGAQAFAGGSGVAGTAGLLPLGAGRALGGGAVAARDLAEPVLLLDGDEFLVGAQEVVPVPWWAEVAPDLGGDGVDVVVGVADGDPKGRRRGRRPGRCRWR